MVPFHPDLGDLASAEAIHHETGDRQARARGRTSHELARAERDPVIASQHVGGVDLEIGKAAPEHPDDLPELLEAEVADGDVMSHEIPADHLVQEVDVASIPHLFIVAG